jgi:hypothetical protein
MIKIKKLKVNIFLLDRKLYESILSKFFFGSQFTLNNKFEETILITILYL